MKRRAPVPRRKALPRGNPPKRSGAKLGANQGRLGQRTASAKLDPSVRMDVLARDGYRCARCGTQDRPLHVHHRLPRSRLGSDDLSNLVVLCGGGWGAGGCHAHVHSHVAEAVADGWILRSTN